LKKMNLLLTFAVIFIAFSMFSNSASAWWNSSWQYRKNITITENSGNTLTDYQVPINITYDADMVSDFSDLRFTWYNSTDTTETEIPYWIEDKVDSSWAYVWVKVPSISALGTETVYVYYGNTTVVSSESNVTNVMIRYETFDNSVPSWIGSFHTGCSYSIDTTDKYEGSGSLKAVCSSGSDIFAKLPSKENGFFITLYYKTDSAVFSNSYWGNCTESDVCGWSVSVSDFGVYEHGTETTWTKIEANVTVNEGVSGDGWLCEETGECHQYDTWSVYTKIGQFMFPYWDTSGTIWWDMLIVRKYSYPEPTYSIGAEERANQPPSITINSPLNQTYYTNSINVNVTVSEPDSASFSCDVWDETTNLTTLTTNTTYTTTITKSDGSHYIRVNCTDSDSKTSESTVYYEVATIPQYSGITVSPSSPQTYGFGALELNLTWTDENNNTQTAWIEHNFTDSFANYTMSNDTATHFYYSISSIARGTYQYRFCANDTAGNLNCTDYYNYTVNPADSELSLTSSAGWTLTTDTSTTVQCSAKSGLSVSLYKDDVLVSNPYTAILPQGTYKFFCEIDDQRNYTPINVTNYLTILPAGIGCTDNSTYAYKTVVSASGSQIVLNLTDLVRQKIIKTDLSDIYLNTSNATLNINLTGGYYALINSENVSSFTLLFGNYYVNNSISEAVRTNNTMTDFSYQQNSNYFYTINLIDEMSGNSLIPPNTNSTTLTMYCSNGATQMPVNDTQFLVATNTQLSQIEFTVMYSATEIYYRDLLINNPIENKNMYVVDANNYQVIQLLMQLQDNTMEFTNPVLHIKKQIGDQLVTITERAFDSEKKAIIYLINGQQYQITVSGGGQERTIGNIYVDSVNLIKTIVISQLITTNISTSNISYALDYDNQTGNIYFNFYDPYGNVEPNTIEFWVYNYTNQSELFFYSNSSNVSGASFNYIVPDPNATYLTKVRIHHKILGNIYITKIFEGISSLPYALLPIVSTGVLTFMSAMLIIIIPMLFGQVHGATAGIIVSLVALMLAVMGFFQISIVLISVALVLAIINKVTEKGGNV